MKMMRYHLLHKLESTTTTTTQFTNMTNEVEKVENEKGSSSTTTAAENIVSTSVSLASSQDVHELPAEDAIRSMYSNDEHPVLNTTRSNATSTSTSNYTNTRQHRHSSVRLRSLLSSHSQSEEQESLVSSFDCYNNRYMNGDFSNGKIRHIKTDGACWTIQYFCRANVLAIGLKGKINFLETQNYTTIHSVERNDKVSAIQWCLGSTLSLPSSISNKDNQCNNNNNNNRYCCRRWIRWTGIII